MTELLDRLADLTLAAERDPYSRQPSWRADLRDEDGVYFSCEFSLELRGWQACLDLEAGDIRTGRRKYAGYPTREELQSAVASFLRSGCQVLPPPTADYVPPQAPRPARVRLDSVYDLRDYDLNDRYDR